MRLNIMAGRKLKIGANNLMPSNKLKRYPFKVLEILGTDDGFKLTFMERGYYRGFPWEITQDFVDVLSQYGHCFYCKTKIAGNFRKCRCGSPKEYRKHIVALIPWDDYLKHINPVLNRVKKRHYSKKRSKRIKDAGGTYTKKEIEELYKIQGGICFYCGEEIGKNKKTPFHKDHYEALMDGGSNDITNIVLACSRCNQLKGHDCYGGDFMAYAKELITPSARKRVNAMHKKYEAWVITKEKDEE